MRTITVLYGIDSLEEFHFDYLSFSNYNEYIILDSGSDIVIKAEILLDKIAVRRITGKNFLTIVPQSVWGSDSLARRPAVDELDVSCLSPNANIREVSEDSRPSLNHSCGKLHDRRSSKFGEKQ
jgi:hypothetical protein